MHILETKKLSKAYENGRQLRQQVLQGIDLQIGQGEFIALMGPSGSGKSTLLHTVSGMDRATEGTVIFNGQELGRLSEEQLAGLRLRRMGFVFQQMHLLKNLNLRDNIILPAYRAKASSRSAINVRAAELMRKTGIATLAERGITEVSGGQLQRAAICRALINQPDILFGDEPTGALNSKSAAEIMDILAEINQAGTTILLATHDARVAAFAERVLYMQDGRIAAEYRFGPRQANQDRRAREESVSAWLNQKGF
ncbi:ABC transporter ATP-binding protein [Paenibacillus ihuae]|uniref:ABC transporter ATP-binding protein n=1 Tax=Paenibacillus ihuae TaxID=1232431 RepID=UPI0006D5A71D|nr:ABC transporter ATP-binding protein [Paenibacillus ihuae]